MVWRNLEWPAYGPPREEDKLDEVHEGSDDVEEYKIKVNTVSEPGSVIEVRNLFHRLYGEPDECDEPNPYIAQYRRLRGSALPESRDSQEYGYVTGTVDFRYWPSLYLGYIENVQVSSNMRRKGLGNKLVSFALDYMRSKGIQRTYSFAVNHEGFLLLERSGFTAEPPDNAQHSWQRWFSKNITMTG